VRVARSQDQSSAVRETWWLMSCAFPRLVWARLRVLASSQIEVFEPGGVTTYFTDEEEAIRHLREDEYDLLEARDELDEQRLGSPIANLHPPAAASRYSR